MSTRTRITIQTRQTIVVRPLAESFQAWCEQCLETVTALTPESVQSVLRIQPETLYGLLETGEWHAVETGSAASLICCQALSNNPTENTILIEGERQ
jgi:hypothetical protein